MNYDQLKFTVQIMKLIYKGKANQQNLSFIKYVYRKHLDGVEE